MAAENATGHGPIDRLALGSRTFESVMGAPAGGFVDGLAASEPDFARLILEWEFGDAYNRPGLDLKTRELVVVAACAALGATGLSAVRMHIPAALRAGATRQEITQVLIQVGFAAGLPAALGAMVAAGEVFEAARTSDV
jgi:4-carboxymuconolactone decarboxylase